MNCQFWPEISFCLNEVEKEKQLLTKKTLNLDLIIGARKTINEQLEQLRLSLEQTLNKQHASLALFPIVAYFDEEMQRHILKTGQGNWDPLQKDFYGAYNAGDLYFETVDKIIEDPQTPSIIFRVFYFILKKGFQGKYRDSKTHLHKYLEILREKIPVEPPVQKKESDTLLPFQNKKKIKPWHYYAGAGAASIAFLVTLYATTSVG